MKKCTSFQPSRFGSLRDTLPQPSSWEAIVDEIRGSLHQAATRHYRGTAEKLAQLEASGDTVQTDTLTACLRTLKMSQPAFVPSVVLEGGRTERCITAYSGYVMADIDGIEPARLPRLMQQVKADVHTFLAYFTLSGRGIRIVAPVEAVQTKQHFQTLWQQVNDYYARLLGVPVDRQCKNATRMSVICHDAGVLYRPDAEPFRMEKGRTEDRRPPHRPPTARAAEPVVRRLVEADGVRYEAHAHNDYICRCLYWMNRFGVSQESALKWAIRAFADYEEAEHSVGATVQSCYGRTDEHATCSLADYRTPYRGKKGRPKSKAQVEEMEAFLNEHVELRMNTLIHQLEFRLKKENDKRWACMTDHAENSLWCRMQRTGMEVDIFRLRTLISSDFVKEFHPLKEYLDSLPAWDGTTDYIGRMAAMVRCANLSPVQFREYFCRWLVGMLAGVFSEKVVNHVILVFLGRQGCFKSSFMENLLPPALRRYYATKTNSQRLTKDDLFSMTENILINFEEIDSMQRKELNQLKAMTTTAFVNERPVYGRHKVRLPHIASFCATGNNLQFLTDDTGTRRWLVAEIDSIENPWETSIPYEGMYAQAKTLLGRGYRYWFNEDEIRVLNLRNSRFEAPNMARELVLAYFRPPGELEKGMYITATQIVARFGSAVRLNPVLVGRALKELGFPQVHTRHGNFWVVVERPKTEMDHVLPEPSETEDSFGTPGPSGAEASPGSPGAEEPFPLFEP